MVIAEMHFDYKMKLNRQDSKKYTDLLIPEIDWKLNEGYELFVKMVANPRLRKDVGFEIGQRTIDDIRSIVIDQKLENAQIATKWDDNHFVAALPTNYWYFSNCVVYAQKVDCIAKITNVHIVKHGEQTEASSFDKSSFNWREVNARFNSEGLIVETDGSFDITKVAFQYLMQPIYMHNAADFEGGTYTATNGDVLTGTVDCNLPVSCHRNIVDLAVLLTTGDLSLPDLPIKERKIQMDN